MAQNSGANGCAASVKHMERLTTRGGVARHSSCFDQKQPPGIVVVSTIVAGYNPQGCRGCHLDCQAVLVRTTSSDTTLEGLEISSIVINALFEADLS